MTYFYILVVDVYADQPHNPVYFIKFGITDRTIPDRILNGSGMTCSYEERGVLYWWNKHDCKVWYSKQFEDRMDAAVLEGEYKLKCVKDPEYFVPVPGKCEWYVVRTLDERLLPDEH